MRSMTLIFALVSLGAPSLAAGQTTAPAGESASHRPLTVEAAAGLTTQFDPVVSGAIGYSPFRVLTLVFEAERLHVPSETTFFPNGRSERRGFTSYMFNGQARLTAPINRRLSAYGMVGFGAGTWGRDTGSRHDGGGLVGPFVGGGVRVAVRPGFSVFGSAKVGLLVGTDSDSLWGYIPIQGGVAWTF
jgi:hypothetical protein